MLFVASTISAIAYAAFAGTNLFAIKPKANAAILMYDDFSEYIKSCCSLASFEYNSEINILLFIDCITLTGCIIITTAPTTIIALLFNAKTTGTNAKFTIDSNMKSLLRCL